MIRRGAAESSPDGRVDADTQLFFKAGFQKLYEPIHVLRCGTAMVNDEITMLAIHFSIADTCSLETELVDDTAG